MASGAQTLKHLTECHCLQAQGMTDGKGNLVPGPSSLEQLGGACPGKSA